MRAPPISSSVTFSPITISAMRGEPRYIDAFLSTMNTTSQNAGMYAPPAAVGGQIGRGRVGEEAVLREVLAAVIAQKGDPLAAEQLACGGVALVVLGRAPALRLVALRLELVAA